jgi:hypothetical protein
VYRPKSCFKWGYYTYSWSIGSFAATDVELHEMSNNKVLAPLRYKIKAKNEWKEFDVQIAHLWILTDEKITAFQQYDDTKKLANTEGN